MVGRCCDAGEECRGRARRGFRPRQATVADAARRALIPPPPLLPTAGEGGRTAGAARGLVLLCAPEVREHTRHPQDVAGYGCGRFRFGSRRSIGGRVAEPGRIIQPGAAGERGLVPPSPPFRFFYRDRTSAYSALVSARESWGDQETIVRPGGCPSRVHGGLLGFLFGYEHAGHEWTDDWELNENLDPVDHARAKYVPEGNPPAVLSRLLSFFG